MIEIVNAISNALQGRKGQYLTLVTLTTPKMLKRGNPLVNCNVTCKTTYVKPRLGCDYSAMVEKRVQKEIGEKIEFHAQKQNGQHYWNDWFNQADNNPDTFYLRVGLATDTTTIKEWFVDGEPATESQIAIIRDFLPKTKQLPSTQAEVGLNAENAVKWRSVTATNIVLIRNNSEIFYQA